MEIIRRYTRIIGSAENHLLTSGEGEVQARDRDTTYRAIEPLPPLLDPPPDPPRPRAIAIRCCAAAEATCKRLKATSPPREMKLIGSGG